MNIRFISSLTPEDEEVFAAALLKGVRAMLDQFPLAYTLRIETTSSRIFQHTTPSVDVGLPQAARPRVAIPIGRD